MLMKVYSIYDTAISTWRPPMFCRAKGEIMRWWVEVVNNPQTEIAKHPKDYVLFELGTWDDDKCKFDLLSAPVSVGVAIEYLNLDSKEGQGSGGRLAPQQSEA